MDKFEEDLKEILAQSKDSSLGVATFVRTSLSENKYPKEFLIYFINSEYFGDYESEFPAYEAWQHQQAKVEELEKEWLEMNQELERSNQVGFQVEAENRELQKRLDEFEQMFKIKWTDPLPSDDECRYDHVYGTCVLGRFSIEWKGWKFQDFKTVYLNDECLNNVLDLDDAKEICQKYLEQALKGENND